MTKDEWTTSSAETMNKAKGLFNALVMVSDSPSEGAEILSAMYVALWQMGHADGSDLDNNLKYFCDCVKLNVAIVERGEGKVQ